VATLTWNEIRRRAMAFTQEWKDENSERAEAQSFWNDFFEVFGVKRRRVAVYEKQIAKLPKAGKAEGGRIDVFWPGTLLAEHKSEGRDLTAAFKQAMGYFAGLDDAELPRYVVVSDFQRFKLYDLDEDTEHEFPLSALPDHINLFGFIAGYQAQRIREQDPINEKAVEYVGRLHDALKQDGYAGHQLEVFLVRLVFCLFADDTGIFMPKDSFHALLEETKEDGSNTGTLLAKLFQVLNQPEEKRQKSLDETLALFPYVNGRLFEEHLDIPEFNSEMRRLLLECSSLNWATISPAIFGAMFQKVIELDAKERRRQLGAHYTSETNILKVIGPLFLDELKAEFNHVKSNKNKLFEFQKKLTQLRFLDPACGCGNFLVITYRELRELELEVLRAAQVFGRFTGHVFDAVKVDVDQFYGIEYEEFPSQIAQVAMWLVDHQMNVKAGLEFGEPFARIPLIKSASIRHGNALRLDWEKFVPPTQLSFILGNPPFIGKQFQTAEQKEDMATVTKGIKGVGVLDYVAGWYIKAAQYLSGTQEGFVSRDRGLFKDVRFGMGNTPVADLFVTADREDEAARAGIRCAFVSTNSITQGEQVGVLWNELLRRGMHIQFAHQTFKWSNDAPGKAAVHCVIVGFGQEKLKTHRLFEYADIEGEPHEIAAANISPYLVDAPDVLLPNRREPICKVPHMAFGSMPNDGGHLLLSDDERAELIKVEPASKQWIRPFLGAEDFINGKQRWCLWLEGIEPHQLKALKHVSQHVTRVKAHREASTRATTQELSQTAWLFAEMRQPTNDFLIIPRHSSERRAFVPIGFLPPDVIAGDSCLTVPEATLYHFGVMSSLMHMAWVRYTCGRLKSDYRYSAGIVYNNFPWPEKMTDKQRQEAEAAAQAVLDARAVHHGATLADLYDPNLMPPDLCTAHKQLDKAVDAAYTADGGKRAWANDSERVAFLFKRYAQLTSLLGGTD
jgi:hypothetical protein